MAVRDPVSSDGLLLLQTYMRKKSFTFSVFVETWRELNFSLIYWIASERTQKAEITELLFNVGVQFLCVGEDLYAQVAGLFLLYAIFFIQPCHPKILIRLTPSQWAIIEPLHAQLRSNKHNEAHYTLCILKSNSAFVICSTDRPMCLSRWSGEQPALEMSAMDETGFGVSPQAIGGAVKEYHQLKQQMSVYLPQHLLNFPSLSQQIEQVLEDYSHWLANETTGGGEGD